MKEHPIIFNSEMVRAILDGRKTQTRKIIPFTITDNFHDWMTDEKKAENMRYDCPYGIPGDRLWVRETWNSVKDFPAPGSIIYKAHNYKHYTRVVRSWKPSIHMPRRASRITLEITDIRVERLPEISEEDATKEGVAWFAQPSARQRFKFLWNSIHGKDAWDRNDWVWVITFRRS